MRVRHVIAAAAAVVLPAACSSADPPVTQRTSVPPTTATATASPSAAPAAQMLPSGYVPLWPFASADEAARWRESYRSGGHSPWHLDAAETALSFASGYLGLKGIDRVTKPVIGRTEAHIAVGYRAEGETSGTAAVVHLFRVGGAADGPWEVVGTDDTTFTLDRPAYGSRITSPVTVGGLISGVDESIQVRVHSPSRDKPVTRVCCRPAGGERSPWTARLTFDDPPKGVLTIVAWTGGHVAEVERFAVTGVRTP